jgi:hypothetical protein
MSHSQYLDFFYYSLLLGTAVHLVLLPAETYVYRATRIKSLIPMIVANVIGLIYLAVAFFRVAYVAKPPSNIDLATTSAALYTTEVVIGVWGTVVFLRTVKNIVVAKNAV